MREGKYFWILTVLDKRGVEVTLWSHIHVRRDKSRSDIFGQLLDGIQRDLGIDKLVVHYFYLERE